MQSSVFKYIKKFKKYISWGKKHLSILRIAAYKLYLNVDKLVTKTSLISRVKITYFTIITD
jgi:hypothetical protein